MNLHIIIVHNKLKDFECKNMQYSLWTQKRFTKTFQHTKTQEECGEECGEERGDYLIIIKM